MLIGATALGIALVIWSQITPSRDARQPIQIPSAGQTTGVSIVSSPFPTNAVQTQTNRDALLPNDPVQLINYGGELLALGKIAEAAEVYGKALKLNPEDEEAHFGLAVAYTRLGRTNDAIEHYEDALKIFPDYPEAHNNLGNLLFGQGQHDKAVQHYLMALKAQPEYTSAMNNLGRAFATQGKTAEALHYFQEAVRIDTNYVEARFNMAGALAKLGEIDGARAEFNEVLRQKPGFPPALQMLARLQTNQPASKP